MRGRKEREREREGEGKREEGEEKIKPFLKKRRQRNKSVKRGSKSIFNTFDAFYG